MAAKNKPAPAKKSPAAKMNMTEAEHRAMKDSMKGGKGMKKGKGGY